MKEMIRSEGRALGFAKVGFVSPARLPEADRLRWWLAQGFAGTMEWMERREAERSNPTLLAPWARTLILATLPYPAQAPPGGSGTGRVSRYARGRDYHQVLRSRLQDLGGFIRSKTPGSRVSAVVDTGAIMEKPWAARAGLGWQGKHTNLIDPACGSWLFVGELLTDLELEPDNRPVTDQCDGCTRCLDACPTDAFPEPYVLDSRRCISYLTIEHRGSIPDELRPGMGDWIFGCDVCQEVCPWNHSPAPGDPELRPDLTTEDLGRLLEIPPDQFKDRFQGTTLRRTGWGRLMRNVAVALGNSGHPDAEAPLVRALSIPDPIVREHAVWALGRLGTAGARRALRQHLTREESAGVREAVARTLADLSANARGTERP